MAAVDPTPFGGLIPQAMAPPAVQLDYDDDILMDYDDEDPIVQPEAEVTPAMATVNSGGDDMDMDTEAVDSELVSPEKIHVRGVDNMNTAAIEAWAVEHFPAESVVRVEWIDDTSCNIVYSSPAVASRAMEALQLPQETPLPGLTIRAAKPASKEPSARLQIRTAKPSDRKERGARERSRYYLFHPEEDRGERFERQNRRNGGGRGDDGDYTRRHFDDRELSRRRQNDYSEDFYDDDAAARSSRRRRSPSRSRSPAFRRRSRDRSFSPDRRQRRRRSREARELFPDRGANGSSLNDSIKPRNTGIELFPQKTRSTEKSAIELFPERGNSKATTSGSEDKFHYPSPPRTLPQQEKELFPEKGSKLFAERELFPEKAKPKPKSLHERITMPGKSLEERITFSNGTGGGISIKGRASAGMDDNDDLFAEKLRQSKGTELFASDTLFGGGGGGRRRRGRNRAEDMFG